MAVEALLDRCMGDAETVTLILDEFESQAVADLAEIKRHVASGDCEGMARVAHALKGASGILSAGALSDIAFKLERMGRAGVLAERGPVADPIERRDPTLHRLSANSPGGNRDEDRRLMNWCNG